MSGQTDRTRETRSLFGECGQLFNHYRTIGGALLTFEQSTRGCGGDGATALTACRVRLSFTPVEVIEAYLDSLLDLETSERELFVCSRRVGIGTSWLSAAGLLFSLTMGLYAAWSGASLVLSFALSLSLAAPFAVLWHYIPKAALARRLRFAKVLSEIIAERRGRGRGGNIYASSMFQDLLDEKRSSTIPDAARSGL